MEKKGNASAGGRREGRRTVEAASGKRESAGSSKGLRGVRSRAAKAGEDAACGELFLLREAAIDEHAPQEANGRSWLGLAGKPARCGCSCAQHKRNERNRRRGGGGEKSRTEAAKGDISLRSFFGNGEGALAGRLRSG